MNQLTLPLSQMLDARTPRRFPRHSFPRNNKTKTENQKKVKAEERKRAVVAKDVPEQSDDEGGRWRLGCSPGGDREAHLRRRGLCRHGSQEHDHLHGEVRRKRFLVLNSNSFRILDFRFSVLVVT